MPRKSDAPRVVGFDFGPPGAPADGPAGPTAAPDAGYPQQPDAAYPPPGYGAPAPEQPYAGSQAAYPPPGYAPPGYPAGAAEPGYPPPGYAAPGSESAAAPYGAPVTTAPQPGYPPAYGAPGFPPNNAFPAPAWTPPAASGGRVKPVLVVAAVVLALVVVIGVVASAVLPDQEKAAPAPAPRKPAAVAKLRTPKTLGSLPRITSARARQNEAKLKKSFPDGEGQFGWYGRGGVPTYQLTAFKFGVGSSRAMLAEFSKSMGPGAKPGPLVAVGKVTCRRVALKSLRSSACAWAGPRSSGVVFWFLGDDLKKLAAVTTKARAAVEGR